MEGELVCPEPDEDVDAGGVVVVVPVVVPVAGGGLLACRSHAASAARRPINSNVDRICVSCVNAGAKLQ
jgi:hypothetical protein